MTTLRQKIASLLLGNNTWILLVVILYTSFNWVMILRSQNTVMAHIYLHPDKWWLFIKFFGSLCLLYFPALCFSGLRSYTSRAPRTARFLWMAVYILWPVIIVVSTGLSDLMPLPITSEVLGFIGMILLVIELITKPKPDYVRSKGILDRLSTTNVEWWVLALVLITSLTEAQMMIAINQWDDSLLDIWMQNLSKYLIYYAYYWLLTRFVLTHIGIKRGIVYLGFAILLCIIIFYLFHLVLWKHLPMNQTFIDMRTGSDWIGEGAPNVFRSISHRLLYFPFIFFVTPLALFVHGLRQMDHVKLLQKEKLQTELNLLKQQINPHFFFNTLNNIYSLSLDDHKNTSASILGLSELMRYVIYKGAEDTVTLQEEVDYLYNYVKLNQIRVRSGDSIEFKTDIVDPHVRIAPLLLIILVENAIKHGIEGSEISGQVSCELVQNGNDIIFTCLNSVEATTQLQDGMGLTNLHRRLELIYPNRYSLDTQLRDNEYHAVLKITV